MNLAIAWICGVVTAGGLLLLNQEAGSQPWWDVLWVLLLTLNAYTGLVISGGLSKARLCAGVALGGFAAIILCTALCGWPLGPIHFTGIPTLRIGNVFPLLPPLLLFSLLALSQRALAVAFPGLGVNSLAAVVAAVFVASLLNSFFFLSKARLWFLWNPWGEGSAMIPAIAGLVSLAVAGFFLSRVFPEDTDLKLTRWSSAAFLLIIVNAVFLAANTLFFLGRL